MPERECTPTHCSYGPEHACQRIYPGNFPEGTSTVWRKRKDAALYGTPYRG